MARDFKAEARTEKKNHPERAAERAARMRARRAVEKKLGDLPTKMQVDHKNGKATDNRMSNLRVVSSKRNNNGRAGGPVRGK